MNTLPGINTIEALAEEAAMKFVMADKSDNASIEGIRATINAVINNTTPGKSNGLKKLHMAATVIEKFCRETIESPGEYRETSFHIIGKAIASLQQIISSLKNEMVSKRLCEEDGTCLKNIFDKLTSGYTELVLEAKRLSMPQLVKAAEMMMEITHNYSTGNAPVQAELDKAAAAIRVLFAGGSNDDNLKNSAPETASGKRTAEAVPAQNACADPALIQDFIHEAGEHLDAVDSRLLMLEADSGNSEAINSVFRAFHTLKSLSGFLEINQMHLLVKEVENLLGQVRNGAITLKGEAIETVFRATDVSRLMVEGLKINPMERELVNEEKIYDVIDDIKMVLIGGQPLHKKAKDTINTGVSGKESNAPQTSQTAGSMIKIDSNKLHMLLDIIGETVIAESMVANDSSVASAGSIGLINSVNQLTKTTKMLHELGLSLRLVPINATFQKMARIARDLSKKHNKQINFTLSGEETEIDRSVVELINDPLVHMIRNAVDHGIENTPEERLKLGKHAAGAVSLKAYHRGGNICIEVSDDGRGLNAQRIRSKAIDLGLITHDSTLPESELYKLIFMPGFSTAGTVTDTSGRGVGMDVVKRNIEALHGRVDIESEKNGFTKFIITMPLTTAIIEAIVVRSGTERFMIPALSILESVRPSYGNITSVAGRGMMIMLRNEFVPVVSLQNLFFESHYNKEDIVGQIIVVVEDNHKRIGIAVDELLDRQQIVVKSMGKAIGKTEGIAGCTIMSDGTVGLIFDIPRMIKMALGREGETNESN